MKNLDVIKKIQEQVKNSNYRFTIHCLERMIERKITKEEIEQAIQNGEIIEEYPQDKYSLSCLILGYTLNAKPLHIQCSIEPIWIITCYDPSLRKDKWSENFKKRRN